VTRPRRVLAFVAAHPDDDVMGAAGLVALHRDDPSFRFVLIHATDGEAGQIGAGLAVSRDSLGSVRRREDLAGWEAVGRQPDRHEWLGLPDGGLATLPEGLLEQRIATILAEERPDVVLTFGPDGITGHPDHIAVGQAATNAFLRLAGDPPGFRRLFHGAYPQSALDRLNDRRVTAGLEAFDPHRVFDPRGVDDEHISCTIDQHAVIPLIVAAFQAHRTQWEPYWSALDEQTWYSAAGANHLVQAWPPRPPSTPLLADPFEGL
jgi:LmbE family N-acetylglucosaminyl deacetylase